MAEQPCLVRLIQVVGQEQQQCAYYCALDVAAAVALEQTQTVSWRRRLLRTLTWLPPTLLATLTHSWLDDARFRALTLSYRINHSLGSPGNWKPCMGTTWKKYKGALCSAREEYTTNSFTVSVHTILMNTPCLPPFCGLLLCLEAVPRTKYCLSIAKSLMLCSVMLRYVLAFCYIILLHL